MAAAMFRSLLVSAGGSREAPSAAGPPGAAPAPPPPHPPEPGAALEAQFSCPICLEVYQRPVRITPCRHT